MATEPTDESTEQAKKPNKMFMIGGVVMGILLLQSVGVFVAVKMIGKGPAEAAGIEIDAHHQTDAHHEENEETGEVTITKLRCHHTSTGKLFVISMTVSAIVPKHLLHAEAAESSGHGGGGGEAEASGIQTEIEANIATIRDRIRTIVSSAEAGTLCLGMADKPDYGLSTLKRQFKTVLDDVLGKGKIKEVLISDYMPTPLD